MFNTGVTLLLHSSLALLSSFCHRRNDKMVDSATVADIRGTRQANARGLSNCCFITTLRAAACRHPVSHRLGRSPSRHTWCLTSSLIVNRRRCRCQRILVVVNIAEFAIVSETCLQSRTLPRPSGFTVSQLTA